MTTNKQHHIRWTEELEGDLQIIERCIARWKKMQNCAVKTKNLRNLVRCRTDLLLIKTSYTLDSLHDKKPVR